MREISLSVLTLRMYSVSSGQAPRSRITGPKNVTFKKILLAQIAKLLSRKAAPIFTPTSGYKCLSYRTICQLDKQ